MINREEKKQQIIQKIFNEFEDNYCIYVDTSNPNSSFVKVTMPKAQIRFKATRADYFYTPLNVLFAKYLDNLSTNSLEKVWFNLM